MSEADVTAGRKDSTASTSTSRQTGSPIPMVSRNKKINKLTIFFFFFQEELVRGSTNEDRVRKHRSRADTPRWNIAKGTMTRSEESAPVSAEKSGGLRGWPMRAYSRASVNWNESR